METKRFDFSKAINKQALNEAMKDDKKRKELERIIANFKNHIR